MKNTKTKIFFALLAPLVAFCIVCSFLAAISNLDSGNALEEKERLEEALTRAAVSCYAIEGAYPPSLEYLTKNYDVIINEKHFTVKYELYASNLMPDITVLVNE